MRYATAFIFIVAATVAGPRESAAQSRTSLGLVGSIPSGMVGFSVAILRQNYVGLYVEIKASAELADTYEDLARERAEGWEDRLIREEWQSYGASIGMTKAFGEVYIFAVSGLVYQVLYAEYDDPTHILAEDGTYWISDEDATRIRPNFTGGVGYRVGDFTLQAGFDAVPMGVSLGVGYVL